MPEIVFGILLFIALTFVAVIVFGGWIVIGLLRMTVRWIGGDAKAAQLSIRPQPRMTCPHDGCHASNPLEAQYCRRCGRTLARDRVVPRRAAIL